MATQGGIELEFAMEADEDLSDEQYTFMVVSADGQAAQAAGTTASLIGVLQNKDADAVGTGARIRYGGISKMVAGEQLDEGERLTSDATGRAVGTTTEGDNVGAVAIGTAAAANVIFEVLVTPNLTFAAT